MYLASLPVTNSNPVTNPIQIPDPDHDADTSKRNTISFRVCGGCGSCCCYCCGRSNDEFLMFAFVFVAAIVAATAVLFKIIFVLVVGNDGDWNDA